MPPRAAKSKKAADVKVAENEGPRKGRGKAKAIEEIEEIESEDTEKVPVTKGKTKRVKKGSSDTPDEEPELVEENGDHVEANGNTEEVQNEPAGRGRKKQGKKESTVEKVTGRGKRNAKNVENETTEKEEDIESEKPKTAKGRGRKAQQKVDKEAEEDKSETAEEEKKTEPVVARGRKKALPKATKENTPEDEKETHEEIEENTAMETKKRGALGRKNQGKTNKEQEETTKAEPASKKRKVTKKESKAGGDSKDELIEEQPSETKSAKGRRVKKGAEVPANTNKEQQDMDDHSKENVTSEDAKKKAPAKNKSSTNYDDIDMSNSSVNKRGRNWNLKIASWNVDGIRAWMNKGGLDYIKHEKPDILCLQEIKCAKDKLPAEIANLPGYHAYWLCSEKDGYAGVGIYTTKLAMHVQYGLQNEELDSEGRIITAEYEQFYLICTYVPNAGRKLVTLDKRLRWNDEFRKYVKELDKKKPVIICGDMNVAHNEIDLANPKTNKKNAGFTEEERAGMTDLLGDGFIDTYRYLNPDKTAAYTFWTYMMNSRAKNVGWRLDYFIVSEKLLPSLCDNVIRDKVYGSDHCPITLFLHLSTADKPKEH